VKTISYTCDRCGKQCLSPHKKRSLGRHGLSEVFDRIDGPDYDLCDDCNGMYKTFMTQFTSKPEGWPE
jgi:hypothetical protein